MNWYHIGMGPGDCITTHLFATHSFAVQKNSVAFFSSPRPRSKDFFIKAGTVCNENAFNGMMSLFRDSLAAMMKTRQYTAFRSFVVRHHAQLRNQIECNFFTTNNLEGQIAQYSFKTMLSVA